MPDEADVGRHRRDAGCPGTPARGAKVGRDRQQPAAFGLLAGPARPGNTAGPIPGDQKQPLPRQPQAEFRPEQGRQSRGPQDRQRQGLQ